MYNISIDSRPLSKNPIWRLYLYRICKRLRDWDFEIWQSNRIKENPNTKLSLYEMATFITAHLQVFV